MTEELFIQLFRDTNKSIYNFVYFSVGRDKHLAEDIAQETFLRAWKYRETYKASKANVKTWLFSIARNLIIDNYKKIKEVNNENLDSEDVTNMSLSLDESIDIKIALDRLDLSSRELITLRYIEELELSEIALIIDKNINSTKVAIHRALQKLKQNITHEP
ncbi:RNA polymerase sigma factor [Candidatus Dojkabacteria bacterium]|uniref:RNA polymerase sigma factor n=1 Tax=Candidatus Dojkabacteria bacterium TaxID=2099670 RepID=A0A955RIN1_9BACT|nr:RNA polymerase sigma factor [Candidatus Dojkabacteria bacterium]